MITREYSAKVAAIKASQVLKDINLYGSETDWKKLYEQKLAIVEAYATLTNLEKYAVRIRNCASYLTFQACEKGHYKKLKRAEFCKCRHCVLCQRRRSRLIYHQVLDLVHAHKKKYSSDIPLLLTLTIPNIPASKLRKSIGDMAYAWRTLAKRKVFNKAVRSWFKALEVTYNQKCDDFHPHYHVLLMVPKHYFNFKRDIYISRDKWLKLWQNVMGMSEITQVDVRRVRKKTKKMLGEEQKKIKQIEAEIAAVERGEIEIAAAEVAKYATKPASYLKKIAKGRYYANPKAIKGFHYGMKGKRLIGFGGLFRKLRKELGMIDVEKSDLIKLDEKEKEVCFCPLCGSTLKDEIYQWDMGLRNFFSYVDQDN